MVESFYVPAGEHTVSITDVADNCSVTGPTSHTVAVEQGQIVSVEFAVVCLATGIALTARTTGRTAPTASRSWSTTSRSGSSRPMGRRPSVASRRAVISSP